MKWPVFLLMIFLTRLAQAQSDTVVNTRELEKIIIISSPHRAMRQTPVTFTEISNKTFEKTYFGQEVSQALQSLPGVAAYTDNGTSFGYSNLRLRGIDQNRLNISLNGLPLNEPEDQGVYFANFPDLLTCMSYVQMQRGIALSKNGVSGLGGSIDFTTYSKTDSFFKAGVFAGSFNSQRIFVQQSNGNLSFKISGLHTNGYKHHSENTSASTLVQWQHATKTGEWKYVLLAGTNKNGLAWLGVPDSLIKIDPKTNGNSPGEKANFSQVVQQLHFIKKIKRGYFSSSVFFNYTNGRYDFDLMNFLGFAPAGTLTRYSTQSYFSGGQSSYNFSTSKFNISTGVYASLYKKVHQGAGYPAGIKLYKNFGLKNEGSAFLKSAWRSGKFNVFFDLQFRYATFSYHGDVALKKFHWPFLNPLAGLGYRFSNNSYLYFNLGGINREPGRNDIFLGNDNLSKDSAGNPVFIDLEPERNFSQELGWRLEKKNFWLSLNLYRMFLNNEITLNGQIGPTGIPLRSNVAKTNRFGFETEWAYTGKLFGLSQSLSLAHHRTREENIVFTPLLIPKWIINNEIRFTAFPNFNFTVQNRVQGSSFIDIANRNKLPSFSSFNFIATIRAKSFDFIANIINVSNKKIYTNGQLNLYGKPVYHIQSPAGIWMGIIFTIK